MIDTSGDIVKRPSYEKAETADYVIFKEDSIYKAKNSSGVVEKTSTDAQTVIQYTINQLTDGGSIYIKSGTYLLTDTITMDEKIHIIGNRHGAIVKANDNENLSSLFAFTKGDWTHCIIEDITIDGNKGTGNANSIGVLAESEAGNRVGWIDIKSCKIINCDIGVKLLGASQAAADNTWHIKIHGNDFGGSGGANNTNIYGKWANSVLVKNNAIEDCVKGIHILDVKYWVITGNWFDDNTDYGIYAENVLGSEYAFDSNITDNIFTDAGATYDGIYIGENCSNFVIIGNIIRSSNRDGIRVCDRFCLIFGNYIAGNGGDGIHCMTDGKFTIIANNFIVSNDKGIYVSVGTTYDVIIGNFLYANSTNDIDFTGANSLIAHNHSYAGGGWSVINTNGVTEHNIGYATEAVGTATIASASTSQNVAHGLDGTPTNIRATPGARLGSANYWYIDNPTTGSFTLNVDIAPGSALPFYWEAIV